MNPTGPDETGTRTAARRNAAADFWDTHYRDRQLPAVPRANPLLVEVVAAMTPGTALDLGCGVGGDALWLARRGWQVTATDISDAALVHVDRIARDGDLEGRIRTEVRDLSQGLPAGRFDLVSAQYFHSSFELSRTEVLRQAADALSPGGRLLVVDHGSTAPWSWNQDPGAHYPSARDVADDLALDAARWRVERADAPTRLAEGPDGRRAHVIDHVLLIRRAHD